MKIAIATLTQGNLPVNYVASLLELSLNMKEISFMFMFNRSALIMDGRNDQFFEAKENGCDYILFVDSDIVFPKDALIKLLELQKDVSAGIYYSRYAPFRPVIYEFTENFTVKNLVSWDNKPFKVDACGAGFLLLSKNVFTIEEPFSLIKNFTGSFAGEDISFCIRCKLNAVDIWVDPSIELGHIRDNIVTSAYWEEVKKANGK